MTGHSVLAVPIVGLDGFVRERTERFDRSYVSRDPLFVHAHVTLLGPWLAAPSPEDLAVVAGLAASVEPFEALFARIVELPLGTICLMPEPDSPFRQLTAALVERFPTLLPYEGRYGAPVPHLTLDHVDTGASAASLRDELGAVLPLSVEVDRIDLQWWANHDCHRLASWGLGSTAVREAS